MALLRSSQDSDFGRRHGLAAVHSYSDFIRAIPPAPFSYYAPYIARCRQGDTGALFGPSQRLLMFAMTSGTTGAPKYIPVTSDFLAACRRGWNIWGVKSMADHPRAYLRKLLQVSSPYEPQRTPGGHPCGSISTALARHQKPIVRRFYAVPPDIAYIQDHDLRYYSILRFALPEDLGMIVTANPSTLVLLAQTADRHAQSLIRDIHDGTLDRSAELSSEVRDRVRRRLRPNRRAARRLQRLLDRHGHLWPKHCWDPALVAHWTGGTVRLYLPQVREYYGVSAMRDIGLIASEGRMSLPLHDDTPAGVLDIFSGFYEFVPQEELDSLDRPGERDVLPSGLTILRADEIEKDRRYYILLSNHAGLYRYHIGDIVRVTDYVRSTPVIEFLSRGAHTSSITGEKLTEDQVVTAVNDAMSQSHLRLTTFTMAPVWAARPYYVLCIEGEPTCPSHALERLAGQVDEALARLNLEYKSKRQSGRLGPVRVRRVAEDLCTDGRSIHHEQHKHRFLSNQPVALGDDDRDGLGNVVQGPVAGRDP